MAERKRRLSADQSELPAQPRVWFCLLGSGLSGLGWRKTRCGVQAGGIIPDEPGISSSQTVEFTSGVDFTEMLGKETLLFSAIGGTDFATRMAQP